MITILCSISGVETDRTWRKEGQKLSSSCPRFVAHHPSAYLPQVMAATIGAAAIMSPQAWISTGGGAGGTTMDSSRKIPTPIQNALRTILSQNPIKNQQVNSLPATAGSPSRPQKLGGEPVTPSRNTTGVSLVAASPKSSDLRSEKVMDEVPENIIGSSKGKAYSQLESLLCEEYISQGQEGEAEKQENKNEEGRREEEVLPTLRDQNNTASSQQEAILVTRNNISSVIGDETSKKLLPKNENAARKRSLIEDEETPLPKKKQAVESSIQDLAPSPTATSVGQPVASPTHDSNSSFPLNQSLNNIVIPPVPPKSVNVTTPLPSKSTDLVPSSHSHASISSAGPVFQSLAASPRTLTVTSSTPSPAKSAAEGSADSLISDLISDTSDSAVISLANQLGLGSVNSSLLNLSDFLCFIQPLTNLSVPTEESSTPITEFSTEPPIAEPLVPTKPHPPPLILTPGSSQHAPPPLIKPLEPPSQLHLPLPSAPAEVSVTSDLCLPPAHKVLMVDSPGPCLPMTSKVPISELATPSSPSIMVTTPTLATPTVLVEDGGLVTPTNYLDLTDIGSLMDSGNDSELLEGIPEDMAQSIQTLVRLDEQAWN